METNLKNSPGNYIVYHIAISEVTTVWHSRNFIIIIVIIIFLVNSCMPLNCGTDHITV